MCDNIPGFHTSSIHPFPSQCTWMCAHTHNTPCAENNVISPDRRTRNISTFLGNLSLFQPLGKILTCNLTNFTCEKFTSKHTQIVFYDCFIFNIAAVLWRLSWTHPCFHLTHIQLPLLETYIEATIPICPGPTFLYTLLKSLTLPIMFLWAWLLWHHLCHISAREGQSPCCQVALEWLPISFLYRVVPRSLSLDIFASGASSWVHRDLCHHDRSLRLAGTMLTLALHFAFYICFNLNEALCWKIDRQ